MLHEEGVDLLLVLLANVMKTIHDLHHCVVYIARRLHKHHDRISYIIHAALRNLLGATGSFRHGVSREFPFQLVQPAACWEGSVP